MEFLSQEIFCSILSKTIPVPSPALITSQMPAETSLRTKSHGKPLTGVTITLFCCPVLRKVFQTREIELCLGRSWAASWEKSTLVLHCCPSAQLPAPARTGMLHQRALGLTRSSQICVRNSGLPLGEGLCAAQI